MSESSLRLSQYSKKLKKAVSSTQNIRYKPAFTNVFRAFSCSFMPKSCAMIIRRTILKQELVKKLYPDCLSVRSALQQLRREINLCPELKEKIFAAGNPRRHTFNKQQLILILDHFCISQEEFEQL